MIDTSGMGEAGAAIHAIEVWLEHLTVKITKHREALQAQLAAGHLFPTGPAAPRGKPTFDPYLLQKLVNGPGSVFVGGVSSGAGPNLGEGGGGGDG